MKETIIILGAGVMQGPAINIAKELGLHAVVLDGSSSAPCAGMADRFEQIDLKDKEGIETFALSIQSSADRLGIMTAGTDFSASVAWVAERLGLPGIPYETALNASDKSRMRECFKKASLPSPDFFTITAESIKTPGKNPLADSPLSFPVVIKPVDNMGSRGCRRVNNEEEYFKAAEQAISFSRSGRAIVEGYLDGPEFSVDAIVYKNEIKICGLADRHIFFPPYFIEMGHTMPTIIDKQNSSCGEVSRAILDTFCSGVRALGIACDKNIGAAKGDIKLTSNGPMIGEIAARLSGGYMSGWTYPYSSGVRPVKSAILMAMGQRPESCVPEKNWTCAERAFISIPGTVKQITINNEQQTGSRESGAGSREISFPNVNDFFLRITEGSKVSFPENNVTKCGNIIASAEDRQTAINAAEIAARSVLIRLAPSDEETDKFLHAETSHSAEMQSHGEIPSFPPDAFQLTPDLKKALSEIPEDIGKDPRRDAETQRTQSEEKILFINDTNQRIDEIENQSNNNSASLRLCENSSLIPSIIPFPAFTSSDLRDYMGRTPEEALQAARILTGFDLPVTSENAENKIRLGRSFWAALIRGSYQGAVYYIDNLCRYMGEK